MVMHHDHANLLVHCELDWDKRVATSRWYDLGELVNKVGGHLYLNRVWVLVDDHLHNRENDHQDGGKANNDGGANEANSHEDGGEANIREDGEEASTHEDGDQANTHDD